MSIALSAILVLIVAVFAFIGVKKGFFKSVSRVASPLLSLLFTVLFYKPVAALLKGVPFIAKMITESANEELLALKASIDGASDLMGKLQVLVKYLIANEDSVEETAKAAFNNVLAEVISIVLALVILFFGLLLIFKLIFKLLDIFASKTPLVKQTNAILGGVVGACEGFFWCWIFSLAFGGFIFPKLNEMFPEVFTPDMLTSVVYQICTKFNPVGLIISLVQLIIGA